MENQKQNKEIKLSKTKHLDLFIILFLASIAIASIFLVLNAFGFFSSVDSYVTIKANVENGVTYDRDMLTTLHFKGRSNAVESEINKLKKVYTDSLRNTTLKFDSYETHIESDSIAEINLNLGQEVQISEELYKVLQKAYELSDIENNNYSIFAGPLYDEWKYLISANYQGNTDADPLKDSVTNDFLTSLTTFINDENSYNLAFLGNNKVKLTISNEYRDFRNTNSVTSPIISLNILENAFKMMAVKEVLEELGYTNGYITSAYGYGLLLSDMPGLNHEIFSKNIKNESIAILQVLGGHSFMKAHNYSISGANTFDYYKVKDNLNNYHYRSTYLNLTTGMPTEYYESYAIINKDSDLLTNILDGQRLLLVDSQEKENNYINNNANINLCYIKSSDDLNIKATASLVENISLFTYDSLKDYKIKVIN